MISCLKLLHFPSTMDSTNNCEPNETLPFTNGWLWFPSNGKLTNGVLVLFVLRLQSTWHWVVYVQEKFISQNMKAKKFKIRHLQVACLEEAARRFQDGHPATVFFSTRIRRERLTPQKPWCTKPLSHCSEDSIPTISNMRAESEDKLWEGHNFQATTLRKQHFLTF